ncbi:MAG: TlpA family protein disulfide reductase [Proteobacteria bacterium]|nr:TlpA family protein disulfide reductase [Pseudomonadota bacterium]NDC24278.1 TlpA family protein disulfide reductase [Pseudomonadota bacterium]
MNPPRSLSPTKVGTGLVLIGLALLYFLEPLTQQRNVSFNFEADRSSISSIPLDIPLKVIVPDKSLKMKEGQNITFQELLGLDANSPETLLINLWATWCDPCIEELPTLNGLGKQLKANKSAEFPRLVTVSVDDRPEAILKTLKTFKPAVQLMVLHDSNGVLSKKLGTRKLPETFLISSKGALIRKWIGPQDWLSGEILLGITQ